MSRPGVDYEFVSTDAEALVTEMIQKYEALTGRTVQPSSPERLLISWMASILVETRAAINYAGNQNIPSRAEGENLDALGELVYASERPGAEPAVCTMRFTISEAQSADVRIAAGTRVSSIDGEVVFATDAEAVIPAGSTYVDAACTCMTAGSAGNGFAAGQICVLIDVDNVLYYSTCANIGATSGGKDSASDDEYYALMVSSEDAYSTAGPRGGYEYWAKSVSTHVADVVVNSPSAGSIAIYALMDDGTIAGSATKAAILAACSADSVRPLTDNVSVEDPEEVDYDITLTYYRSNESDLSSADLQAAVQTAVDNYILWQAGKLGRAINPSKLISMIVEAGAKRVEVTYPTYLQLEDGKDELDVQTPQIAKVGTVTLTYGGTENE